MLISGIGPVVRTMLSGAKYSGFLLVFRTFSRPHTVPVSCAGSPLVVGRLMASLNVTTYR